VADLERVQSLHRLFFALAGTRNTEHLDFKEGKPSPRYKHRLLEVFDECAHLGYSPTIQKHFSLASGYGIQGVFVFQDFSQLFDLYGRNESITSNCDVKVASAPNSIETAEYLSRVLGMETREKKVGAEHGIIPKGGHKQRHSFGRALLTPDECARLPRDRSLILRNGFPPILGDKVPYFEVPLLFQRTQVPPPNTDRIPFTGERWWAGLNRSVPARKIPPKPSVTVEKSAPPKSRKPGKGKDANKQIDLFDR
jgi:type IV secretion system protein VirD4